MDTVIVGINEHNSSERALDFAIREAASRDARLRIVHAWDSVPIHRPILIPSDLEKVWQEAQARVDLARQRAATLEPEMQTESKTVFGEAAHVLIDEAKDALGKEEGEVLLVVGSGMLGSFAARSAGHELLHNAPCPVTIVRAAADEVDDFRHKRGRSRLAGEQGRTKSVSANPSSKTGITEGGEDCSVLSVAMIAALGKVDHAAVERCIREDPKFPKPVARLTTGDIYDRTSIYRWAIEAGSKGLELAL